MQIGPFEVLGRLGAGGMGEVLRVRDALGRQLALKLASERVDRQRAERFRREGELTARLQHPGIVAVHGAGEHQGRPYLVYELVAGEDLEARLADLDLAQRLRVVLEVAAAVGYAHAQGVIHRDLKPANVLIDAAGSARVADFGLAQAADLERLTLSGAVMGTCHYMSPEQATGLRDQQGPPSDVWSLGVLLYRCLTDALPFEGTTVEILARIVGQTPTPPRALRPDVPAAVEAVCLRALAKAPADRYPHGEAFRQALAAAAADGSRSRGALRALGAACALAVGLGVGALTAAPPPGDAPVAPSTGLDDSGGTSDPRGGVDLEPEVALDPAWVEARQRVDAAPLPALGAALQALRGVPAPEATAAALADAVAARALAALEAEQRVRDGIDVLERAAESGLRVRDRVVSERLTHTFYVQMNALRMLPGADRLSDRDCWRYYLAAVQLDLPLHGPAVFSADRVSPERRPRLTDPTARAWFGYLRALQRMRVDGWEDQRAAEGQLLTIVRGDGAPLGPRHWSLAVVTVVTSPDLGAGLELSVDDQLALLQEADRRFPRDPWVSTARATILMGHGRHDEAWAESERSLQLVAEHPAFESLDAGWTLLVALHHARVQLALELRKREAGEASLHALNQLEPDIANGYREAFATWTD